MIFVERGCRSISSADSLFLSILGRLRSKHILTRCNVTSAAGETLFVTVIDCRDPSGEEEHSVRQDIPRQNLVVRRSAHIVGYKVADSPQIMVPKKRDQAVRIGRRRRIKTILGEKFSEL